MNSTALTDTEALQSTSGFSFSGASMSALDTSDAYTLSSILVDVSSSVSGFRAGLVKALESSIGALLKSPRAEAVLARVALFNSSLSEVHGFVPVGDIKIDQYDAHVRPCGSTALFDAALSIIETTESYGDKLLANRLTVNGIGIIITDGDDNSSVVANRQKIKDGLERIKRSEKLESFKLILVGVGPTSNDAYFQQIVSDCGFDQYVFMGDATAQKLARLADFVSKSVSSSSQALGTGGGSKNITF